MLYYRFGVSLQDVSELMLARGIEVSHEAIRLWTMQFGTEYARRLRRTRGTCSNIWHLDELCLVINGKRSWLWRAVDDAGEVLDILVQRRRSALAAKRFFRKLLKGLRMGTEHHRDRSAGELRSGESRGDADCLASPRLAPEQPRRELAPTRPAA
jgi:transposase-like protein